MSLDPCTVVSRSHLVARALYAKAAPAGVVEQRGPVHVAFSGSPAGSFNTAFILEPLVRPRADVKDFVAWAATFDLPYHVYLREGVDAAAEEALRSAGFSLLDTEPWMLADPITDEAASSELATPLEIRPVVDPGGFHEHLVTAADAFEMRAADVVGAFPETLLADERLLWFTGYVDGRPVATLAAVRADQVLDLQNVGVLVDARRAGNGSAITRHGMFVAHQLGCTGVSLQASPMGERLHRRLGFRAACHYRIFASPAR